LAESLRNRGFEQGEVVKESGRGEAEGDGDWPEAWRPWKRRGSEGQWHWNSQMARSGRMSLLANGLSDGWVFQDIPVVPNRVYLGTAWVKARVSAGSEVRFQVHWQDSHGRWLWSLPGVSDWLPPGQTTEWELISVVFRVPDGVGRAAIGPVVKHQEPGDYAYFDDVSLKKID
jgi:hypothetical protein